MRENSLDSDTLHLNSQSN